MSDEFLMSEISFLQFTENQGFSTFPSHSSKTLPFKNGEHPSCFQTENNKELLSMCPKIVYYSLPGPPFSKVISQIIFML
jgi:hypothetical protein